MKGHGVCGQLGVELDPLTVVFIRFSNRWLLNSAISDVHQLTVLYNILQHFLS